MNWLSFIRWVSASLLVSGVGVFLFVLVMDPYQNVGLFTSLKRAPVAQNQRFSYPAIARQPGADSAVIGSSVARLIKPSRLNAGLESHFVNLAMNDATPLEQRKMLGLFLNHHPSPRYLLFAIDNGWCATTETRRRYTIRGFPDFMYDTSRWNDLLYLFNDKALENAVRMAQLLLGSREPKYGADGYDDFSNDPVDRHIPTVRTRIHGSPDPIPLPDTSINLEPAHMRGEDPMAELMKLGKLLSKVPFGTRAILIFPPMHAWQLQQGAKHYRECKARVLELTAATPNVAVLDFMLDGDLVRSDGNFLDPIHYVDEVAMELERVLIDIYRGDLPDGPQFKLRQPGAWMNTNNGRQ